jgi:glycosyltransferase involved in cell wall biosynthesis
LEEATLFLPVSDSLGKTVNKYFATVNYQIVPNVVNTEIFYFTPTEIKKFRFLHPSTMNFNKNPEGLLEACKIIKKRGYDFEVLMVGNQPKTLVSLAKQLDLSEQVSFIEAVSYADVAKLMQHSSSLLMFSRFENLPCVILEVLCCGIPVIGTSVGGIPELIDKENGLLVESENIPALAKAMMQMMDNYKAYNPQLISEKATALFNYKTVAKQYTDIYNKFI